MMLTAGVQLKINERDYDEAVDILQSGVDEQIGPIDLLEDGVAKINLLLHRARGWILLGFLIIPGWISFPVAYFYATKALSDRIALEIDDLNLKRRIGRIRYISALFSLLFWGVLLFYIIDVFTDR